MNLYQIEMELQLLMQEAEQQAEQNAGEISDTISDQLDCWEGEKEKKISNTCKYIKNMLSEYEAVAGEAKKLNERARVAKNKAEWVKAWLSGFLNGEKWSDANSKITWRGSQSVAVADENLVPACYFEKILKIKKADIKAELKAGGEVPGCKLEEKQNIQIK